MNEKQNRPQKQPKFIKPADIAKHFGIKGPKNIAAAVAAYALFTQRDDLETEIERGLLAFALDIPLDGKPKQGCEHRIKDRCPKLKAWMIEATAEKAN